MEKKESCRRSVAYFQRHKHKGEWGEEECFWGPEIEWRNLVTKTFERDKKDVDFQGDFLHQQTACE